MDLFPLSAKAEAAAAKDPRHGECSIRMRAGAASSLREVLTGALVFL